MAVTPPRSLVRHLQRALKELLARNPAATSSEAYTQHHVEFSLINARVNPRYSLRIGINYHGQKVQQIQRASSGTLHGWNPGGDALGAGDDAKLLLAGHTILPRDPDEPLMNDTKIGGGEIPAGSYVRAEFKVRGWLGKTRNLDGKQLEKDLDLLKRDRADLLVICLSETAHRKWRGEGPPHQAARRTGTGRFRRILISPSRLRGSRVSLRYITFERQRWCVSTQRVVGAANSLMPEAEHFVTLCWRARRRRKSTQ